MKKETTLKKLQGLVLHCDAIILYEPMKEEIDVNEPSFPLKIPTNQICVPKNTYNDPFIWADTCKKNFKDNQVCILIPGTQFDVYGTRYGRGSGWYDRFLSKLPFDWLRVGIIDKSMMSHDRLERQPWDQPVDWVLTRGDTSWITCDCTPSAYAHV